MASAVRRSGPEQVSESQREFIDLAFRMSLMEVAGSDGVGSLVIDAPESSLDAVFVTRAADVLSRFAAPDRRNRLIITSNLVEGRLLPTLLERASAPSDRTERLVDLFKLAEPTAAVREFRAEYHALLASMIAAINKDRQDSVPSREASPSVDVSIVVDDGHLYGIQEQPDAAESE